MTDASHTRSSPDRSDLRRDDALLPCPFCGGEEIELWTGFGTQAEIGCVSCGCERAVQVADMREDGEPHPEFDSKTFRYPDWLIERTNKHLISEWNTRAPLPGGVAQGVVPCGEPVTALPRAVLDIANERFRQIEDEGWSPEHDDKHGFGEMANAAACYAMKPTARTIVVDPYSMDTVRQRLWPWAREWWKPTNRRRDLVKAGALIVAEIERLDRASSVTSTNDQGAAK